MEKFSKQEVDDFRNMYNKFDDLVGEIIDYIISKKYVKYLTGFRDIEDYGYLSCDTKTFDIRVESYGYEDKDYYFLEIPWEHVYNNSWKEYLDDQVKEDVEKERIQKENMAKFQEMRERQQLKKLLEKYGDQETV